MASVRETAHQVMALYPRIYFACHTRHVRDPESHRLLSRHQASILDHLDEIDPTTVNGLAGHMGVPGVFGSRGWGTPLAFLVEAATVLVNTILIQPRL